MDLSIMIASQSYTEGDGGEFYGADAMFDKSEYSLPIILHADHFRSLGFRLVHERLTH
jgi:hypothetical protein